MADDEVTPLTSATTNYGFVKPDIGASDDVWGGLLNTDLDNIDSTIKGVSTVANAAYPTSNPSGYQTAAQVTAVLPVASSTTPLVNGTAAVGTGTTWARADHVHPTDTSGWLGDNRIINGDMRIDARNNGASGVASGYTVDRWNYTGSQANKGTWQQRISSGGTLVANAGFFYFLDFTSSSAYAAIATDSFNFGQSIEADMVSDFAWGSSGAQSVMLSFWARSSLTGTFSGSIRNYALTRSYPFTYSLPAANTFTKITVSVPGDTAGTWVMNGSAGSVVLDFDLGGGSNLRGPANVWAAANYIGATGSVSVVATNGASLDVTGVKLEIGSVATPFNRPSSAKSMADCQRYYQQFSNIMCTGYAGAGSNVFTTLSLPAMRATPTVVYTGSVNYLNASAIATNGGDISSFRMQITITATGFGYAIVPTTTLSAEL